MPKTVYKRGKLSSKKSLIREKESLQNDRYLKENLIAYIGNKRRLLPLINRAIESTKIDPNGSDRTFLDLFAGSGVVSRLAKRLGFEVHCNDWEYYSYIINRVFITFDKRIIESGFEKLGGFDNALNILNSLREPSKDDSYISLYYCPSDDINPDKLNERMFYTNYNGKKIDAIRGMIELWLRETLITKDEMELLLALLLYEASTRSNTSGVFKGFHNGFGGTNGDALSRILREVELIKPELVNGKKCYVYQEDANMLAKKLKATHFDIAYLDPPYNQHQYGSNYHLLNTIAKNDKPEINKNIYVDGKKIDKSAIRKDWINTRSSFCYKSSAKNDFEKIVESVNASHILVSYSIDGIIEFDDMLDILSRRGKLSMVSSEYVKFRGGKQSLTNEVSNIEFILIVDTNKKGSEEDIVDIKRELLYNRISLNVKKRISKPIAYKYGFFNGGRVDDCDIICKIYDGAEVSFQIKNSRMVDSERFLNIIEDFSIDNLNSLLLDLDLITNIGKDREIEILLEEINSGYGSSNGCNLELFKDVVYLLSKFNNKKAYLPSLNIIKLIFETMSKDLNFWTMINIIESGTFIKFEKIISNKLSKNGDTFYEEREECCKAYRDFMREYNNIKENNKNDNLILLIKEFAKIK